MQWMVPVEIREKLALKDGAECRMSARLGAYLLKPKTCVLTSGGEIRLSKAIADALEAQGKAHPLAEIIFNISRTGTHSTRLEKARKEAVAEQAFDPHDDEDARSRAAAFIVRRQGQPEFRKRLLKVYNNRCAISGCDCPDALEAAHIRPYKGRQTNNIRNGLLLRSDIHTLFDLGKMRIDSDYTVRVSQDLLATVYRKFHNHQITLPRDREHWPIV